MLLLRFHFSPDVVDCAIDHVQVEFLKSPFVQLRLDLLDLVPNVLLCSRWHVLLHKPLFSVFIAALIGICRVVSLHPLLLLEFEFQHVLYISLSFLDEECQGCVSLPCLLVLNGSLKLPLNEMIESKELFTFQKGEEEVFSSELLFYLVVGLLILEAQNLILVENILFLGFTQSGIAILNLFALDP